MAVATTQFFMWNLFRFCNESSKTLWAAVGVLFVMCGQMPIEFSFANKLFSAITHSYALSPVCFAFHLIVGRTLWFNVVKCFVILISFGRWWCKYRDYRINQSILDSLSTIFDSRFLFNLHFNSQFLFIWIQIHWDHFHCKKTNIE